MQKKQERSFKFFGQDGWVELDLIKQKLIVCYYDSEDVDVYENILDNDGLFQLQANYFLNEFKLNDYQYLEALKRNSIVIDESVNNIN